MRNLKKQKICALILALLCLMLFSIPATAQEEEVEIPGPVRKIDLGVESLHLNVGESYSFQVRFEPAATSLTTLDWTVTDERVLSIDPQTDTITALADGEARLFAESFDGFAYAVCNVTVGSVSKDASVMKSGSDFMGLTPEELGKISAETLSRYLDFVADSGLDESSYEHAAGRYFDVLAEVKPGTEEEQAQRARECGIEDAEALTCLNSVTLNGDLASILKYIKGNDEVRDVYEFGPFWEEEPDLEEVSEESVEKAIVKELGGRTQELTNINFARSLGLNGKGRTIAIIDSGLNRNNPVFSRKPAGTITEVCYSSATKINSGTLYSVCRNGATGAGASAPSLAPHRNKFNHGSHVAGIAAGADGIAPGANIISIQTHAEKQWKCKDSEERKRYSCGANNLCCKSYIANKDTARAYDYLINAAKSGKKIDAVNMSYGDGIEYKSAKECGSAKPQQKSYMDKLAAHGMLPVAASGNDGFNKGIAAPACHSSVYAVGGLGSFKTPKLRKSSNHSTMVDITAPGTDIWSADNGTVTIQMSGTSMAAPMVTGAVALVKQMYPGMSSKDVGTFLKVITGKSVNVRSNNVKFNYKKPVLNFTHLMDRISVPYYSWVTGGNHSITIKLDRLARNASYSAEVKDLNGNTIPGCQVQWKNQGSYTYVKVFGGELQNDTIYKVTIHRSVKISGKTYKAVSTQYGLPVGNINPTKLTIRPGDRKVTLKTTGVDKGVQYRIYDTGGNLIRTEKTTTAGKPFEIRGLTNGKVYKVTAAPYREVTITKNGVKNKVLLYGQESAPVSFMVLKSPVNAKYSFDVNTKKLIFSSSVDPAADGIWVRFKSDGGWKFGCKSQAKNNFSCQANQTNGTFEVMEYKNLNGKIYYGPSVTIKR